MRMMLLIRARELSEGLALIEDAEGHLPQECLIGRGCCLTDVAFSKRLEHADGVDAQASVDETLDEASDGQVPRGVTQFSVLPARAHEALFFPVAEDPRGGADLLGQPGDRHQLILKI
jgi:hypothetical protein